MNVFQIKNTNFRIVDATLKAHLSEKGLRWAISIRAEHPEKRFLGAEWAPRAYSDNLAPLEGQTLNYWTDIIGRSIEWDDCYDPNTGDPIGSLYVFEHLDIYKSKLIFRKLNGADFVQVEWTARCDVFFGDEFGENLELFVQTEARFLGIEAPFQNEIESRDLLKKHIRNDSFEFIQGESIDSMPLFRPKRG